MLDVLWNTEDGQPWQELHLQTVRNEHMGFCTRGTLKAGHDTNFISDSQCSKYYRHLHPLHPSFPSPLSTLLHPILPMQSRTNNPPPPIQSNTNRQNTCAKNQTTPTHRRQKTRLRERERVTANDRTRIAATHAFKEKTQTMRGKKVNQHQSQTNAKQKKDRKRAVYQMKKGYQIGSNITSRT